MFNLDKEYVLFSLGLKPEDKDFISSCAGNELIETNIDNLENSEIPLLAWFGSKYWQILQNTRPDVCKYFTHIPKVLILENDYSMLDLENALDQDFDMVIKPPLSKKDVFNVLKKLVEARNLQKEIKRLGQEIELERELITRKSAIFDYMIKFHQNIERNKNPLELVSNMKSLLADHFKIASMHLAWWGSQSDNNLDIYLDSPEKDSPTAKLWLKAIYNVAYKIKPNKPISENIQCLKKINNSNQIPEASKILVLPLTIYNVNAGVMVLGLSRIWNQGRDYSMALEATLNNFALHLEYMNQNISYFNEQAEPKAYVINLP